MTHTPASGGEPVDIADAPSGSSLADLPLFTAPMSPLRAEGRATPVDGVERPERQVIAGQRRHLSGEIDWALVRAFRQQVADRLAKEVERREGLSEQSQRELGRALITETVCGHPVGALQG